MDNKALLPICQKLVGVTSDEISLLEYVLYLKEEEGKETVYLDSRDKVSALVNLFVRLEIGQVGHVTKDNVVEYTISEEGMKTLGLICNLMNYTFKGIPVEELKRSDSLAMLLYLLNRGGKATMTIEDLREIYHVTGDRLTRFGKWKSRLDVISRELGTIGVILTVNPHKQNPTSKITKIDFQIVH